MVRVAWYHTSFKSGLHTGRSDPLGDRRMETWDAHMDGGAGGAARGSWTWQMGNTSLKLHAGIGHVEGESRYNAYVDSTWYGVVHTTQARTRKRTLAEAKSWALRTMRVLAERWRRSGTLPKKG